MKEYDSVKYKEMVRNYPKRDEPLGWFTVSILMQKVTILRFLDRFTIKSKYTT